MVYLNELFINCRTNLISYFSYYTVIDVAMEIKKWRYRKSSVFTETTCEMATEGPEDEIEPVEVRLERLFGSFCCFGVGKDAPALMDGTKFAKFCKDMGLVGKNLTTTDVDIIFAQSKP